MDWINNFFIPLAQIIFGITIISIFVIVLGWALYKNWIKTWQFKFKYEIIRKQLPKEEDMIFIINTKETRDEMNKRLLVENYNQNRVYEMLYLYDKIKGVDKNAKKNKRKNQYN